MRISDWSSDVCSSDLVAITLLGGITLGSCSAQKNESPGSSIERLDAGLDSVIDPNAYVEIIGKGFNWSEGPLWVEQDNMLLFSDVLENKIYKWTEQHGVEPWLEPSGYTGSVPRGRSEEHTSELQSLMRISYAVLCLKKTNTE